MNIVGMKLAGGKSRFPFSLTSLFFIATLLLASCGGGSGSPVVGAGATCPAGSTGTPPFCTAITGTGTATAGGIATTVNTGHISILGMADKISVAAKPSSKSETARAASPLAGAAVTVIGGDGVRAGSTTTGEDGSYSLKVPGNATYVVKIAKGNVVMKAVRTVGTADATINVNPGTTVTVAVLESALHTVLDDGTSFSAALSGVDVNAAVTQITALPSYSSAASAAAAAIAANTNPATTASTVATTTSTITHVALPAAPTGVSAAAGNAQATVSWSAVAGADSYNVYYRTLAGVTVANGIKAISASAGSTITGLTNGTAYYFVVTAVNAGGESAISAETSATPQMPVAGVPSGVTAAAGNAQATVGWTAVAGASSYNVYYKASSGVTTSNSTKIAGATSGSVITGLTNGMTYYFVVTAVNSGGESAVSGEVSATPQMPIAGAPTGVTATAGNGQATVSWATSAGAASYNVYYKASAGVTIANGTRLAGASSGAAITGLTNATTYYFVVTAVNAGGESAVSGEVSATPQAPVAGVPSGVTAAAGNGQATVSWTAVTGATSYNVYYRASAGVTTANATKITGAASGNTITGLINGLAYYFVVTAVTASGESAASSEASAMPTAPATSAPTGVTATAGNAQATVSWTAVTGAISYNLYYRTTAGVTAANGTKLAGATSGAAITGLANGTVYYFVVTAVNSGGESAASSEVSATPTAPVAGVPSAVTAAGGNGQATVSWTAVTGATSYNVYYRTTAGVTIANGTKVAGATSGAAITGLANGTVYYFVVTAVSAGGESAVSSQVSATPTAPVAGVPSGVTVAAGNAQATVSWTAVTGATSYNVYYRATTAGVTIANGTKVIGATSGAAITNLINGTTYYFVVTAVSAGGESAVSSEVSATPTAPAVAVPTGLTATAGNAQTTLSWTAVIGATSYNAYYRTTAGVTIANGTKVAGATSGAAITGLANGTAYYFVVTAVSAGAESAVSSEVSATPTAPAPVIANLMGGAIQRPLTISTGSVTTFAGGAGVIGSTDATGTAARFNNPLGLTTDGTNLYVTEFGNHTIRKVVIATGAVTTLAGGAGVIGSTDGIGMAARFNYPTGITTDGTNLYVADSSNFTIRKIVITTGAVTTLAGSAGVTGSTDATGTAARFNQSRGITTDGTNLYVADYLNHTIRQIVISTGVVTTLAGSAGVIGSTDGTGTAARFNAPTGITTDGTNLYVASYGDHTIRKVVIATAVVTTVAGSAGVIGSTDGTGTAARFSNPVGITTDSTNLYVVGYADHTIRKVVIATAAVTTVAGSAGVIGSTDGTGTVARFNIPYTITTNGTDIYVADGGNHTIRKIGAATAPAAPTGVTAAAGNAQATVSWTAVAGATSYNVYYGTTAGVTTANGTKITAAVSGAPITGLTNATPYYFVVTTIDPAGESVPSAEVTATPAAPAPVAGVSGTFSPTGSMGTARYVHTGTLLPNGKVLIAAGYSGTANLNTAELYDPGTGLFIATGAMNQARHIHTATLLQNGKVLITGGQGASVINTAELYDPATGLFSSTGSMNSTRREHAATLLPNGKVLITGGHNEVTNIPGFNSAELYDPATGTFAATGSMSTSRWAHRATLLQNGKVLIVGGYNGSRISSAELYDPATGTFTLTGNMSTGRSTPSATLLASGKVLVAGGYNGSVINTAELYDPGTGVFTATGSMTSIRQGQTDTLLPNGQVLLAGGDNAFSAFATAELYDPATGVFTATGSMSIARSAATLLPNGKVLVTGGWAAVATAELYN